jgi:hypothetical protein
LLVKKAPCFRHEHRSIARFFGTLTLQRTRIVYYGYYVQLETVNSALVECCLSLKPTF